MRYIIGDKIRTRYKLFKHTLFINYFPLTRKVVDVVTDFKSDKL